MESNLGERLEQALFELDVSQAQLAKRSGISQQSISYIIRNKISDSKLAPKLASALGVSPTWLILGIGNLTEGYAREIPVINSYFILQKFLRDGRLHGFVNLIFTEIYLGKQAFAYQTELKQVAICSLENTFEAEEFLFLDSSGHRVVHEPMDNAFPIYEWRRRNVEY
ncbi:XRE family transcriptional regulator [Parashewanella curva]|uniref:XRE family transcriptional regulator n=1 Tax=Parashewanella curva TaxID=2338552 RepID=A0A3L8PRR9_9GAMM|nr:helix-turn-helix transcriptional regulator [Parashewanella curva]RLV58100.1 XRE family transcriptional regulator [Parashewanella curva]